MEHMKWGFQDLRDVEFRRWGAVEMGSSRDGNCSTVQKLSYKGLTRAVFCLAKAKARAL